MDVVKLYAAKFMSCLELRFYKPPYRRGLSGNLTQKRCDVACGKMWQISKGRNVVCALQSHSQHLLSCSLLISSWSLSGTSTDDRDEW